MKTQQKRRRHNQSDNCTVDRIACAVTFHVYPSLWHCNAARERALTNWHFIQFSFTSLHLMREHARKHRASANVKWKKGAKHPKMHDKRRKRDKNQRLRNVFDDHHHSMISKCMDLEVCLTYFVLIWNCIQLKQKKNIGVTLSSSIWSKRIEQQQRKFASAIQSHTYRIVFLIRTPDKVKTIHPSECYNWIYKEATGESSGNISISRSREWCINNTITRKIYAMRYELKFLVQKFAALKTNRTQSHFINYKTILNGWRPTMSSWYLHFCPSIEVPFRTWSIPLFIVFWCAIWLLISTLLGKK